MTHVDKLAERLDVGHLRVRDVGGQRRGRQVEDVLEVVPRDVTEKSPVGESDGHGVRRSLVLPGSGGLRLPLPLVRLAKDSVDFRQEEAAELGSIS